MLNTGLLSLIVGNLLAIFLLILLYPTSYAFGQNQTTDDAPTIERADDAPTIERADDAPTIERADDAPTIETSTKPWRKATLIVSVEVVGGEAEVSDFTIQVTSSGSDNSIQWEQYPEILEGSGNVILRVSDMPSSQINYEVKVIDQPNNDYSPTYEGCSGSWELGGYKTCKITNYFEPQPSPDFQIVAEPRDLITKPESLDYSTLTLLPSEDNSGDAIINIDLDTEWIGTPPRNDDVSVSLEQVSTRLIGTQPQDIRITVQTSQDAPPGQTFTLNVRAYGEVDQQQPLVSRTANLQIAIPHSDNDNNVPQAVAVLDKQQVEEGESANLDGSRSWDADGDSLTYYWQVVSGPANGQISDEQSDMGTITFETPQVNEDTKIIFQLTVSDGKPGGIGITTTELSIDNLASDPESNGERTNNPLIDAIPPEIRNIGDGLIRGERTNNPLIDAIPPEIRNIGDGLGPAVAGPSNNNMLPILLLTAIIGIGGIALAKYKASRGRSRKLKIPPSALVEVRSKGGISR